MRGKLISTLFFLNVALMVASCVYLSPQPSFDLDAPRQPVRCSQITEDALLNFPFNQLTWQEAVEWVRYTYKVEPRMDRASDGLTYYLRWEQGGKRYTTSVVADAFIDGVAVSQEENPPVVREILDCYGKPTFYEAFYDPTPDGPTYTALRLWYPKQGLVFYGSVPLLLPDLDPRMPIRLAAYVEPSSDIRPLKSWKPWPGDLREVVIEHRY